MNIAYVRVSTVNQHLDRQVENLKKIGIDKWYKEKVSAKNIKDRPQLKKLLREMKEGDKVYVHELSRIARSTADLLTIVSKMDERGVVLVSCKEGINSETSTGKLILSIFASVFQFERECILERQREGIRIAKQKGRYKGRKRMYANEMFVDYYHLWKEGFVNLEQVSKSMGVSKSTVYRNFKEIERAE